MRSVINCAKKNKFASVRDTFSGPSITISAGVELQKHADHTFICGSQASLEARLGTRDLTAFDSLNKDIANKASFKIPEVGSTTLIVVPKESSRHNSEYRPDALAKTLLAEAAGKKDVRVILVSDENDHKAILPWSLAVYRSFPLVSFKSSDKAVQSVQLQVAGVSQVADEIAVIGNYIRVAQALVDLPASVLSSEALKTFIQEEIKDIPGVSADFVEGTDLRDHGFGGIWGVGMGAAADRQPKLIVLSYYGDAKGKDEPAWCLVGKGIIFDTGGLAIKGRDGMCGMKRDMGGSAGVLGGFLTVAKSKVPRNVHCVLAVAENSVSGEAFRHDDVLTLFSGKTVEINNTDAEGRLVLGDAVAFAAAHLNPAVVMDMATLTGAQGIATGKLHAALVSNDDEITEKAVKIGKQCGDLCWPLPYCPELFLPEFKSELADMKNSVACRSNAQVSCAGSFVADHLPAEFKGTWLHCDMAYPVHVGARATGYGVALIAGLLGVFQT
eukprot:GEMP01035040.1.p1 GENE.GEMP01035040.1~~GEMP01035040.1.p1  ORF type:complete len:499 (+),score=125.39 GEMP01035040.1:66-1562(+)